MADKPMGTLVSALFQQVNLSTFDGSTILQYYPEYSEDRSVRELLQYFKWHGGTRQWEIAHNYGDESYPDLDGDGIVTESDVELIGKLVSGDSSVTFTEIQKDLADADRDGKVDQTDQALVKAFVEKMGGGTKEEWYQFRNSRSSQKIDPFIGEFIVDHIDLDLSDWCWWTEKHDENSTNKYWNESIEHLNQAYLQLFDQGEETSYKIVDGWITVYDIVNADAGYRFDFNEKTEWVKPFYGLFETTGAALNGSSSGKPKVKSYSEVRDYDKIRSVLADDHYLQFTRKYFDNSNNINRYIRLIMPMYKRVVEVEDLNRNFWVIGQTIGGICEYLFKPDNPLMKFLKYLIDEVTQLWENVLYLWVMAQYMNREIEDSIKVIQIPLTNGAQYDWVKYDDFNRTAPDWQDKDEILRRTQYLIDTYYEQNLIIVPEIRQKGYFKNYYAEVIFPGMVIWNTYTKKKCFVPFYQKSLELKVNPRYPVQIDLTQEKLGWKKLSENGTNDDLTSKMSEDKLSYVRPKVSVKAHITKGTSEEDKKYRFGTIVIDSVEIDCSDNDAFNEKFSISSTTDSAWKAEVFFYNELRKFSRIYFEIKKNNGTTTSETNNKGVYFGEVVSWKSATTFYEHKEIGTLSLIKGTNQRDGDQNLDSEENFIKYLDSDKGTKLWETLLQGEEGSDDMISLDKTISDQNNNSIQVYICNAQFKESKESSNILVEACPYLTYVYKNKSGESYLKTFILHAKVPSTYSEANKKQKLNIHQKIPFPYASTLTNTYNENGAAMLGRIYAMKKDEDSWPTTNAQWDSSKEPKPFSSSSATAPPNNGQNAVQTAKISTIAEILSDNPFLPSAAPGGVQVETDNASGGEDSEGSSGKIVSPNITVTGAVPGGHVIMTGKEDDSSNSNEIIIIKEKLEEANGKKVDTIDGTPRLEIDEPIAMPAVSYQDYRENNEMTLSKFLEDFGKDDYTTGPFFSSEDYYDLFHSGSYALADLSIGTMNMSYANNKISVSNFYIYCVDKSFIGMNDVTDLVPYYYYCTKDSYNSNVINCTYGTMSDLTGKWKSQEKMCKYGYGNGAYLFWKENSTPIKVGEDIINCCYYLDTEESEEEDSYKIKVNDQVQTDFEQFLDKELEKQSPNRTKFRDMNFVVELKEVTADGDE